MKNVIQVMLLALLFLVVAGQLQAQRYSPSGEFSFEYVEGEDKVITGLGKTINIGNNEVNINDEGHIYMMYVTSVTYTIYFSPPFLTNSSRVSFVEYAENGAILQVMAIRNKTVIYRLGYNDVVETTNTNNKWLDLWSYK